MQPLTSNKSDNIHRHFPSLRACKVATPGRDGEIVSPAFMSQPNLRILSQPRDLLDPDSIVGLRHLVWSGHLVMARPKLNSPRNMNVPHAHFIILSVCLTVIQYIEVSLLHGFTKSLVDFLNLDETCWF